jgi:hypothetical protein
MEVKFYALTLLLVFSKNCVVFFVSLCLAALFRFAGMLLDPLTDGVPNNV